MIVITDTTGITVKTRIQDISHVRLGLTQIMYWVSGYESVRTIEEMNKPHFEYTLNELAECLQYVQYLQRLHNVED